MGFIKKARTGGGRFAQAIGWVLFGICALVSIIWMGRVFRADFGFWVSFLLFWFTPIEWIGCLFYMWFKTGMFPLGFLAINVGWLIGLVIVYIGEMIKGEG